MTSTCNPLGLHLLRRKGAALSLGNQRGFRGVGLTNLRLCEQSDLKKKEFLPPLRAELKFFIIDPNLGRTLGFLRLNFLFMIARKAVLFFGSFFRTLSWIPPKKTRGALSRFFLALVAVALVQDAYETKRKFYFLSWGPTCASVFAALCRI